MKSHAVFGSIHGEECMGCQMDTVNNKVRIVLAVGVALAVAATAGSLAERFGEAVRESILAEDTGWLAARIAIGAVCAIVALAALALGIRGRLKRGGRERSLASDFCAMVSFAAALPIVVLWTLAGERGSVCDCTGLLLAELLFFPACSMLVAVRTGKVRWIAWLALYLIATAMVVLYPAVSALSTK